MSLKDKKYIYKQTHTHTEHMYTLQTGESESYTIYTSA